MDRLDEHPELDVVLADAAPRKIRDTAAQQVLRRMAFTQWRHSHAEAAAAAFEPREAVRRQLTLDFDATDDSPLRRAVRRTQPDQLIALAIEFADSRLVALAAAGAASQPTLLSAVDVTTTVGQEIWAGALAINTYAWSGPAEPRDALYRLLESVLASERVISQLLLALSRSPLADLSKFPNRSAIWGRLDDDARGGFLAATADAWLAGLTQGVSGSVPELELEDSILETARLSPFLEYCANQDVACGVQLFSTLPNAQENSFVAWLARVFDCCNCLSAPAIECLGQVVVTRRWPRALATLVQQFRNGRRDLLSALRICNSMLSVWDRYRLGITSLSKADKWAAFGAVAIDLYPSGPDHDELWERAGGRNADLENQGKGSARWQAALQGIDRGRPPIRASLLRVMRQDYPLNAKLQFLADDREFGGSHH